MHLYWPGTFKQGRRIVVCSLIVLFALDHVELYLQPLHQIHTLDHHWEGT